MKERKFRTRAVDTQHTQHTQKKFSQKFVSIDNYADMSTSPKTHGHGDKNKQTLLDSFFKKRSPKKSTWVCSETQFFQLLLRRRQKKNYVRVLLTTRTCDSLFD